MLSEEFISVQLWYQ